MAPASPHTLPCPAARRYGCTGPEIRREYHAAGPTKRLQLDANQLHFRVVAAEADGSDDREAVVGASAYVSAGAATGYAGARPPAAAAARRSRGAVWLGQAQGSWLRHGGATQGGRAATPTPHRQAARRLTPAIFLLSSPSRPLLQCTVDNLKSMACQALGIADPEQWELWDYAGMMTGQNVSACGTAAGQRSSCRGCMCMRHVRAR